MQISTQQLIDTVATMSEGLQPRQTTLNVIRDFAYSYRVNTGQAYSLN